MDWPHNLGTFLLCFGNSSSGEHIFDLKKNDLKLLFFVIFENRKNKAYAIFFNKFM